jgi:pimeloyl-ACP methyl ester carboxylesterase
LPPFYRTVATRSARLDPAQSTLNFPPNYRPKRVALFSGVRLATTNALFRNLAIVSLSDVTPPRLGVVDISDPLKPNLLKEVELTGVGIPQTLQRRDDGLLAVSTSSELLLFDPAGLLLDPVAGGNLPGWVGTIPGAGAGAGSFAAGADGVNAVNLGSKHEVHFTSPTLRIIALPQRAPMTVDQIVGLSDQEKYDLLAGAEVRTRLLRTRFFDSTNAQSLLPPNTNSHYYVRVDAVGSLGPELELVLEGLSGAGLPVLSVGSNRPPGRLASVATRQQLGDTNTSSLFTTSLKARQLAQAAQKGSPLHNIYLAGPFALTGRGFSAAEVSAIQSQLPRIILTAGRALWVGLDPNLTTDPYPAAIRSTVAQQRLVPGTAVFAQVDAPPLPVILIPGVAGSHLTKIGTFLDRELWPGFTDIGKEALTLDPSESQSQIVVRDIVRVAPEPYEFPSRFTPIGCLAAPIYQPLLEHLTERLGLREYDYLKPSSGLLDFLPCLLGTSQTLQNSPEQSATNRTVNGADYNQIVLQPNLFVFPYDWRRSNVTAVAQLEEYVEVVKRFHPEAEQVNIVAHSMGGLVARRFILDNPGVVNRLITLGSPWLGAPKAINALETGDFLDFIQHLLVIKKSTLKKLAEFFLGPQELVPSPAYFTLAGSPFVDLAGDLPGSTPGAGGGALTFEQFRQVMDQVYHTNTLVNPAAVTKTFHDYTVPGIGSQDDWSNDNTGVEYFHIVGIQSQLNTIGKVTSRFRIRPNTQDPQNLFELKREFSIEYTRGDGTVPLVSSSRINGGQSLNAPGAQIYPLVSPGPAGDKLTDHNGMLANPLLLDLVGRILDGDVPPTNAPAPPSTVTYVVRLVNAENNEVIVSKTNNPGLTTAPFDLGSVDFIPLSRLFISREEDIAGLQIEEPATNIVDAVLNGNFELKAGYDGRPISVRVEEQVNGVPQTVYLWRSLDPSDFTNNPPSDFEAVVAINSPPVVTVRAGGNVVPLPPDAVCPAENEPPRIVFTYTNDCTAIQFGVTNETVAAAVEYYYQPVDPLAPGLATNLFKIDDQNIPGFLEDLDFIASLNGTRRLRILAQDGNENVAAPIVVDLVKLEKLVQPTVGSTVPLTDIPENPAANRLRSPNRYLSTTDALRARVTGVPNQPAGYYKIHITSETDTNGAVADLIESQPGSGVYENQDIIEVGSDQLAAVKIVEEEILTFQVLANSTNRLCSHDVMVDAGEFASGGIDIFYLNRDRSPVQQGALTDARFSDAGDGQFGDCIGVLTVSNNPMARFILAAGANLPARRQADVLHVSSHGGMDGFLFDHCTFSQPVFDPSSLALSSTNWNQDVEWAVLAACNVLNDDPGNLGLARWQKALMGFPRPAHGLLGANYQLDGNLDDQFKLFWERLNAGDTFPQSYKLGMTIGGSTPQPWVVSFYAPYAQDSLTNLAADLGIQGVVSFFTERFTSVGPTNITCGRADGPRLQSVVNLNLTSAPVGATPPTLQLRPAEPLRALAPLGTRQIAHGGLQMVEFQPPASAPTPERITAELARVLADNFLQANLPSLFANARFSEAFAHTTTRTEPSGASTTWTNGFLIHYRLSRAGLPVWGDRLSISVEAGRVTRVACVSHEPMPSSTPAATAQRPAELISSRVALDRVQPAIETSLDPAARAVVLEAELGYVRSAEVNTNATDPSEFILSWRFTVEVTGSGPSRYPVRKDYWANAVSGELLGQKVR